MVTKHDGTMILVGAAVPLMLNMLIFVPVGLKWLNFVRALVFSDAKMRAKVLAAQQVALLKFQLEVRQGLNSLQNLPAAPLLDQADLVEKFFSSLDGHRNGCSLSFDIVGTYLSFIRHMHRCHHTRRAQAWTRCVGLHFGTV